MKRGNLFFTFDTSPEFAQEWLKQIEELKARTARNREYAAFVRNPYSKLFEQTEHEAKPEGCTCHLNEYEPEPVELANDEFVIDLISTCSVCYTH